MWSQFKSSKTALKRFATLLISINGFKRVFSRFKRILKPLNIVRDSVKLLKIACNICEDSFKAVKQL